MIRYVGPLGQKQYSKEQAEGVWPLGTHNLGLNPYPNPFESHPQQWIPVGLSFLFLSNGLNSQRLMKIKYIIAPGTEPGTE